MRLLLCRLQPALGGVAMPLHPLAAERKAWSVGASIRCSGAVDLEENARHFRSAPSERDARALAQAQWACARRSAAMTRRSSRRWICSGSGGIELGLAA